MESWPQSAFRTFNGFRSAGLAASRGGRRCRRAWRATCGGDQTGSEFQPAPRPFGLCGAPIHGADNSTNPCRRAFSENSRRMKILAPEKKGDAAASLSLLHVNHRGRSQSHCDTKGIGIGGGQTSEGSEERVAVPDLVNGEIANVAIPWLTVTVRVPLRVPPLGLLSMAMVTVSELSVLTMLINRSPPPRSPPA